MRSRPIWMPPSFWRSGKRPFLVMGTLALALASLTALRADHVLILGDSLSKEYEVTFPGFDATCVNLPIDRPGIDPTNPSARNWAEILHQHRSRWFDQGIYKDLFDCPIPDGWDDLRLSGREYNWAVAGGTARFLRNFTLTNDLDEWEDDGEISDLLATAEFLTQKDWREIVEEWSDDIDFLIGNSTDAVVIFCGGNDLKFGNTDPLATANANGGNKISYGTIYSGDGTGTGNPKNLVDSIRKNIRSLVQHVRAVGGDSLPIVVCSVPHVGATPNVKADGFTDPVRTARCTAAIEDLNDGLARLATEFNCGFADVYQLTKDLLDNKPFDIGGVRFFNEADPLYDGNGTELPPRTRRRYLFTPLKAPANDGFHPTTAAQAKIANIIVDAFKAKYPTQFSALRPLSSEFILTNILELETNIGFREAIAALPSSQRAPTDDPDGDSLPNIVEYALAGLDPAASDAQRLPTPMLDASTSPARLTFTWTPRFADNAYASLVCQYSTNLTTWPDVPTSQLTTNPDGSITASIPTTPEAPVFVRLKASVR